MTWEQGKIYMQPLCLDIWQYIVQDYDLWKKKNQWDEPYHNTVFLLGVNLLALAKGGEPEQNPVIWVRWKDVNLF